MAWKPIGKSNAINRVRLLIQFKEPLKLQDLEKISNSTLEKFRGINFDQLIRAEKIVQNIPIESDNGQHFTEEITEGWVINRGTSQNIVEEAGFRVNVFGYMTTEYESWKNLKERFWEIFNAPLCGVLNLTDIGAIRIEYWNKFLFNGQPSKADTAMILTSCDPAFPKNVFDNNSLLHSHIGWFEKIKELPTLVQRNIDLKEEQLRDKIQRVLDLYALVEVQQLLDNVTIDIIQDLIENAHNRVKSVFDDTLTESIRKKIV